MQKDPKHQFHQEKVFLHEMELELNCALFIVDRLTEEIKEEEGRLEDDPEAERFFQHLSEALSKIDRMIKRRHNQLHDFLEAEKQQNLKEEKNNSARSPDTSFY
ncbi:hypothetical protein D3C87_260180 [compost metagenome]